MKVIVAFCGADGSLGLERRVVMLKAVAVAVIKAASRKAFAGFGTCIFGARIIFDEEALRMGVLLCIRYPPESGDSQEKIGKKVKG